jgi:hypothetical protein
VVGFESKFVHQSTFWEANSNSTIDTNQCLFVNPNLHYLVHNISPFERTIKRPEDVCVTTLSLDRTNCGRVLASWKGRVGSGLWSSIEYHAEFA